MTQVPIIDISALFGGDTAACREVANKIGQACRDIGFIVIVGHQVRDELIDRVWKSTQSFFDLPTEEKMKLDRPQDEGYPYGYTHFGGEVLSAGKAAENSNGETVNVVAPPDLKEMFSLGPENPAAGFPPRQWPTHPIDFEANWTEYYRTLSELARNLLKAFSMALNLSDENYFEKFIDHHASALRAINYPAIESADTVLPGQLRASAHTDYGTMTILKTDGPGLQVCKDVDPPAWVDVPHVEGAFVINLGDLMRRWSNDAWLSTLHRVVIPTSEVTSAWQKQTGDTNDSGKKITRRRQSIAFFHNVNRDAVVEVLLRDSQEAPKHPPIVAGDFLMQKHLASIGAGAS